jgi:hypothetical protein
VGAAAAALRVAARLRALEAGREVRTRSGAARRSHSRPPAGQPVGPGVGEHLPAGGPQGGRARRRPHRPPQGPQHRRQGHGALRRGLLHLPRLRAPAGHVLGALPLREAARPRGGLPRQRLGRGRGRGPAHQDVHRGQRGGLQHHPPRAGAQLLPARLQQAALPLPRQRQRRLPRGHRRHHRPLGDAGLPEGHRPHRPGARRLRRHRPPPAARAGQGGLRALRAAGGPVALEGVQRPGDAGQLQRVLVGAAHEVPGRGPAARAQRGRLRPRGQVPRAGQRALHALLHGPHPPVPVPPRAVQGGRAGGAAAPLLHLRQQGGRPAPAEDAGDGPQQALAGRAGGHDRRAPDGRHGRDRLLRPAQGVARQAERGQAGRLVGLGAAGPGSRRPSTASRCRTA